MTRAELLRMRPGDYIWYAYNEKPVNTPSMMFMIVARFGTTGLHVFDVVRNLPESKQFFEFQDKTWDWRSYNYLPREEFLNNEYAFAYTGVVKLKHDERRSPR